MKRKVAATGGILSGTRKWVTGGITTLAALMALMVNARNLGLSPWLGLFDPNYADRAARRIVLTPRGDTLRSLGDSSMLIATVTDARGGVLVGASVQWRSSDSTVATVDSGGTVVARAPGRTVIEVRVWEVTARAALLVRPVPARVTVGGDTVRTLADGDTLRLSARVLDARGHEMPGVAAQWTSSDTLVARVDSAGTVQTSGPGRALVVAAVGELQQATTVHVVLTPTTLVTVAGDGQRALAGRTLPEPLVLQAVTRTGQPVPGVTVALAIEDGDGTLSQATPVTDARGRIRTQWTLSRRAGAHRLLARLPSVDSSFALSAEADPLPANTRIEVLSSELRGRVRDTVPEVRARVTDTLGVALAGVRVAWDTPDGGRIEGSTRTDSTGLVSARWTLGRRAGSQRLLVQVGNPRFTPAHAVRATALPGPVHALAVITGDAQRAVVGSSLRPIVLVARDSCDNPIPEVAVTATLSGGSLLDTSLTTGGDGRATLRWTLPTKPGDQRLEARTAGAPARVVATARARVGPATVLDIARQTGSSAGKVRLVARLRDAHGNAVANASLSLAATAGSLSGTRLKTDSTGRALLTWTPPAGKRGAVRITATLSGARLSGTHLLPAP